MIEAIEIQIDLTAVFWDRFPEADLLIDHVEISKHVIDRPKYQIKNTVSLAMDQPHFLQLSRRGKSDDQCRVVDGQQKDQYIIIDRVSIDGIDIQNLVWSQSWYEPEYPDAWSDQQRAAGIDLETKVLGETWLSHNGVWNFGFSSPFYKFLIDQFRT